MPGLCWFSVYRIPAYPTFCNPFTAEKVVQREPLCLDSNSPLKKRTKIRIMIHKEKRKVNGNQGTRPETAGSTESAEKREPELRAENINAGALYKNERDKLCKTQMKTPENKKI